MEKIVYDPTEDRKQKKPSPLASDVVKAKIKNNEVKVKGRKRETRAAKPEKPITEPTKEDLEGFLAILKRLGRPSTSREISDALGIKDPESGRALVRRMMAKLAEEGKIKMTEVPKGKRGRLYDLVKS